MKLRLDEAMVERGLVHSRSHAARLIKMGKVRAAGRLATKPGTMVYKQNDIEIIGSENYVSRAGFKLASVVKKLNINFNDKIVLDIGSSTGGFTDYALQNGAKRIIAVDVGTKQLHPELLGNDKIDLFEKTDIRDFDDPILEKVDISVADLSFISLREIIPNIVKKLPKDSTIVAMVKPQFEAGSKYKHKGVIKNDTIRRKILKEFEDWVKDYCFIIDKADSEVTGSKGNRERFYLLKII